MDKKGNQIFPATKIGARCTGMALEIQAFQAAFAITWITLLSYIGYLVCRRLKMVSRIRKLK